MSWADRKGTGTGGAPLNVTRRGPALWLTLNRPAEGNGIDGVLTRRLHEALDLAERDAAVHVVVLAGAGPVFCTGVDLKVISAMAAALPPEAEALHHSFLTEVGTLLHRVETFGKPVIAAVGGLAVAGGLELVLVCDIVIATRSARFGDGHANYGLLPGGGASVRLPRRVGPSLAKYLMFTGEDLPATDLAHTDLITLLVGDDELDGAVERTAASIAAKSPPGIARMKQLVTEGMDTASGDGMAAELRAAVRHVRTKDFAEGLAAFTANRRPEFTGR